MLLTCERVYTESVTSGRVTVTSDGPEVGIGCAVNRTTKHLVGRLRRITTALYH